MQTLWELVHALDVRSKRMARQLGVTGPQRLVVRLIGQTPGAMASDISTTLGMHPSTLTGVLARLEAQGIIHRGVDDSDRRRSRLELTAEGKRVDAERKGTVEAAVRRALARAQPQTIEKTVEMLELLVSELDRDD